jgi:hypothetical protein
LPWSRRSMRASTVSSDGKGLKRRARIWKRHVVVTECEVEQLFIMIRLLCLRVRSTR